MFTVSPVADEKDDWEKTWNDDDGKVIAFDKLQRYYKKLKKIQLNKLFYYGSANKYFGAVFYTGYMRLSSEVKINFSSTKSSDDYAGINTKDFKDGANVRLWTYSDSLYTQANSGINYKLGKSLLSVFGDFKSCQINCDAELKDLTTLLNNGINVDLSVYNINNYSNEFIIKSLNAKLVGEGSGFIELEAISI